MTTCPTCRQRIATDRALPHANDTDDGAARLWASYILGLIAKYPLEFKAKVVGYVARGVRVEDEA
tara:strand:+ start:155 stop:349 length:195 start_codon:yes stop_codon:yes gene_type:complete